MRRFMEDVNKRRRIFLSLLNKDKFLKNSTPGEIAYIRRDKVSKEKNSFFRDVFTAAAVVRVTSPPLPLLIHITKKLTHEILLEFACSSSLQIIYFLYQVFPMRCGGWHKSVFLTT